VQSSKINISTYIWTISGCLKKGVCDYKGIENTEITLEHIYNLDIAVVFEGAYNFFIFITPSFSLYEFYTFVNQGILSLTVFVFLQVFSKNFQSLRKYLQLFIIKIRTQSSSMFYALFLHCLFSGINSHMPLYMTESV